MPQAKETESHRIYFPLSYIPSTIPVYHGGKCSRRTSKARWFFKCFKRISKKVIFVSQNNHIENLGFAIFDPAWSRINGFSLDFDFILYSFYRCWPMQTAPKLYLTHKAAGSLQKKDQRVGDQHQSHWLLSKERVQNGTGPHSLIGWTFDPRIPIFIQLLFLEYDVAISKAGPVLSRSCNTQPCFSCERVS